MNVLILGLNYAPEPVGIGPYTAGMARAIAASGHNVTVVCTNPFYPDWKVDPAYAGKGVTRTVEDGVRVVRVPCYVPGNPDGKHRLVHHASFALRAQFTMLAEARRRRPDVIVGIAPSLISIVAAHAAVRMTGAKFWLHVQDFEVEAAFATGLLDNSGMVARLAKGFEGRALRADRVSSISRMMCGKLEQLGIPSDRVVEFRNWANIDQILPLAGPSPYRAAWGIDRPHVAVYSGNIANKQGIGIVVEAARLLQHRKDLMFVVCGNGPNRAKLMESSAGLDNIQFHDLQPAEQLSDLLGLATIHLLPQIASAADLLLPSKLANMLASGRPVVATAEAGTGLAAEVEGCGIATPPGDARAFAAAIEQLSEDAALREQLGATARVRAEERWDRNAILGRFVTQLAQLAKGDVTHAATALSS